MISRKKGRKLIFEPFKYKKCCKSYLENFGQKIHQHATVSEDGCMGGVIRPIPSPPFPLHHF